MNKRKRIFHNDALLRKTARLTLAAEGVRKSVSLTILVTGDREITGFNRRFFGKNRATDVISFGTQRFQLPGRTAEGFLGDIVISAETARYNTTRFGTSLREEISLYIAHGVLHLLGYDDQTKRGRLRMESKQERIINGLCGRIIS
ncbi:MAG: rRNA maturation RNase YbeY [Candidatus Omnitrophota bacterium]